MRRQSAARIPTLDGWRCIAIAMVLYSHVYRTIMFGNAFQSAQFDWMNTGQHGVSIFFVLSGYLITTTLLHSEGGRINLPEFYARRMFRLMPASLSYLAFIVLLGYISPVKQTAVSIIGCLFLFRNYLPSTPASGCTAHFWSLSLEEQFYLVWPFLLAKLGRKVSCACALLVTGVIAVYRYIRWNAYSGGTSHTEIRVDAILIGCVLAILLFEYEALGKWFMKYGGLVFSISSILFAFDVWRYQALIPTHEEVLIALMIASTVRYPRMIISHVLETKVFKMIGVMSYSIYVWHMVFVVVNWHWLAYVLGPIFICFSWFCIEKPCIARGRQFLKNRKIVLRQFEKVAQ